MKKLNLFPKQSEVTLEGSFNDQFRIEQRFYLEKLDFLEWYRYFFIFREILDRRPRSILEAGTGNGILRNCIQPLVQQYTTIDLNSRLEPDIVEDLKVYQSKLESSFDCVIAADILEHLAFEDLRPCLDNLHRYLTDHGMALITIPNRRSYFLFMTPTYKPHVFSVPTGFLSPGSFYRRFIKRKIYIDPNHRWEIGDGKVSRKMVESEFRKSGFEITKFKHLLYVDFWFLKKERACKHPNSSEMP